MANQPGILGHSAGHAINPAPGFIANVRGGDRYSSPNPSSHGFEWASNTGKPVQEHTPREIH
jgi:hypothetical protein